ncbi:MAG TPA: hypothetical protein VFS00_23665, partial [Polyangiaceae bacterium]|nr:hypothetical protein [Polyangiaceae bacterium]
RGRATAWSEMPRGVLSALWAVTSLAYTFSGLTKLASPSWVGGRAVGLLLDGPLARAWWPTDLLAAAPAPLLAALGWALLGLEFGYAPLALSARARPWLWVATLAMHAGLALTMNFADISIAMIAFHLALAEPAWFAPAPRPERADRGPGPFGV